MLLNIDKLTHWSVSVEKSVGGLEFIGFSKLNTNKLLCISSQKETIIDCENASINVCNADYDEAALLAVCDALPDEEIIIAGQYGGALSDSTAQGDRVLVSKKRNGRLVKYKVEFITAWQERIVILDDDYCYYTCGFSYDGNYFAFAGDVGICVLKRI